MAPWSGSYLASGAVATLAKDFTKPVGVAKLGNMLVVTDARERAGLLIDLASGTRTASRDLDRPDTVTACGDSVLVTTYDEASRTGCVRQLWPSGRARIVARGGWEPRGIATDGELVYVAARRAGRVLVFEL